MNIKKISFLLVLVLLLISCEENELQDITLEQVYIDTVYSVKWGKTQNFGRSAEFFPKNIFGPPSRVASKLTPEASEEELASLGRDGEIIVGAKNHVIVDKPGVDFIVFENVFATTQAEVKVFVEPAIVSVSQNGVDFVEFPYDPKTLEGLAGLTWTNGSENPFDYTVSGGDGFDLAKIGIDSVKYIKIKDISKIASTMPKDHKYYSPEVMISGFDLDAIAIINAVRKK